MRILYVITGLGVGGAERQVVDLAEGLVSRGHSVAICYLTGPMDICPSAAVPSHPLGMGSGIGSVITGMKNLRNVIRTFNPDVVHSHMVHANILTRLIRLFCPIRRLICTAHSNNEGGRLRMLAYRVTDRLADVSTNVSQTAVDTFIRLGAVPQGRMIAVPNGIDINRFTTIGGIGSLRNEDIGVPAEKKIILAVGRLVVAKDYPNLLKAFADLSMRDAALHLVIAGDGDQRGAIEALADNLGISESITLLGVRKDVAALYKLADVYVLSSAWEGFGLVVAEAMASECLVVATDCGGVKEVLGSGGILVQPADHHALAAALQTAMDLPAIEAGQLRAIARQQVERNYALPVVLDTWQQIYEAG